MEAPIASILDERLLGPFARWVGGRCYFAV